jgi:SIR2-like domain
MLFLGAGASKAVGLSDLQDLTSRVKVKLEEKGYKNVFEDVIGILEKANQNYPFFNNDEIDLEMILTVLKSTVNHKNALKKLGPYAIFLNAFLDEGKLSTVIINQDNLAEIKATVENVITNSLNRDTQTIARKYYQDLFQISRDIPEYKTNSGFTSQPPLFDHIVTTNYDRVIENLYEDIHGRSPRMGFDTDIRTGEYYLDIDGIANGKYQYNRNNHIEYLKLHGSIDWWIRGSDKRIIRREHNISMRGEQYPGQLMVYPVYEKYISQDPYFSLYHYFRSLLYYNDVYLVIGFSFRDPSINSAFKDALINKRASRMIIVNSNVKDIQARVYENFPEEKVYFVEAHFGDDNLSSKLKDCLR